jgi:hypothetical protein
MLDGRWRAKAEQGLEPIGRGLHAIGVSADALTVFGLVAAIGTGLLIANGNLVLAVFGLILSGLPDILDGSVTLKISMIQNTPRRMKAFDPL